MLTNKQIKLINSLHSKKGRTENGLFLVEGEKGILEVLDSSYQIEFLVINEDYAHQFSSIKQSIYFLPKNEITKLSTLTINQFGIAVVKMKNLISFETLNPYVLVLDGVRDPGNLGTIIRICDWYGIDQIVLSADCTEFYNPKVISATMGSFKRVKCLYTDLPAFLTSHPNYSILGADLDGENIHAFEFPDRAFLIMGSESHGIREDLHNIIQQKITIPRYGGAESLNVAISTGIILDNLKRN
ncbi:TrmH family RNA methyltransferase [Aquirufa rosea]|uniref:RNA methyltransferase n=1 Tax=Aquirufa rosea TaxID=2509241 RepID=A0A4V1M5Q5_9BACT|nr:RNA methyltransferase [Aquirufa rosea]RXK52232.1 RNA methyltransferase [Aquirufa rosea]